MVVDVASVLPELRELPATVLALSLQILLHSALLPVRGFLHVPPEQSLLEELLSTDVTSDDTNKGRHCKAHNAKTERRSKPANRVVATTIAFVTVPTSQFTSLINREGV